ncbi:hypothetical protein [Cytobacillus firmus]|uniref:hypothetical protein n=1 Tax=Cytobacillus firmus TaxID=1399 RepID=UPI001CFC59E4|nr:hypothetical protein [Cytobacillus firmus]URT73177.1 hypothetical protein NAF01_12275 [Cytobacillus firmus]WHY64166.1 hypothetical protein QNH42_12545 [Cytobacillus firmus]
MIFCTIARPNQLAAALILAKSIKKHHPEAKMALCLTSKNIPDAAKRSRHIDHVVSENDIGSSLLKNLNEYYSIIDRSRAIKAPFLNYLFNQFTNENIFIYLDCFTKVFAPFSELLSSLDRHSIIYSTYCLTSPSSGSGILNEFDLLKNGNINGGFLAFKRTEESTQFIKRFNRLIRKDVNKNKRGSVEGLFIDERWLCLMIGLFNIYFFKHPSYHLAVWNLHESERKIERTDEGSWGVKGDPIKSMYFADLKGSLGWTLNDSAVNLLQENYKKRLSSIKS